MNAPTAGKSARCNTLKIACRPGRFPSTMSRILFLTHRMFRGYGADLAVLFDNLEAIQEFIERCATDRRDLFERAAEGYRYVRARFSWSNSAKEWLAWISWPGGTADEFAAPRSSRMQH